MLKPSVKRPSSDQQQKSQQEVFQQHWSDDIYECVVSISANGILNLSLDGGSDNGDFAYFGELVQERITYSKGKVEEGDIILEVQGQKVAGYTQRDIVAWLNHCCRNGSPVTIKAVRHGSLTRDLRQYLNARFQKGSLDHDLQNTIRDNLYLRTVPCTTRLPRENEVNGVDYTFLSPDEFVALEKSGNLLESGIYEGNHYGTPKPPSDTPLHSLQRGSSSVNDNFGSILPGAHPSSEGKRRRNRSNVEAMASKSVDPEDSQQLLLNHVAGNSRSSTPSHSSQQRMRNRRQSGEADNSADDSIDLGPLPDNWEKAYTETGEPYFIDHNSGNSQWLDPRLARVQKKTIEDCQEDELPYGWERIDDPHYGTYYIDHVNRRTQYENPVLQARRRTQSSNKLKQPSSDINEFEPKITLDEFSSNGGSNFWYLRNTDPTTPTTISSSGGSTLPLNFNNVGGGGPANHSSNHSSNNGSDQTNNSPRNNSNSQTFFSAKEPLWPPSVSQNSNGHQHNHHPHQQPIGSPQVIPGMGKNTNTAASTSRHRPYQFTCNPAELQGDMIATTLVKSSRGFGFTIVGGDDGGSEEFLQIKSVVPNGPAWSDGKLKTGDVLVYVNKTCVLGFSHQDMVLLFQSIPPEEMVLLEVCRGYPLPFDPEDPNNEIVTTMAVQADNTDPNSIYGSRNTNHNNSANGTMTNGEAGVEALGRSAKSMPDLSVRQSDNSKPQRHNSADLLSNGDNTPDILDFSPGSSSKPEYLTVEIVKGTAGFGFTIADSAYGQKVKKILDRPRCKLLQEGDILVKINQQDVRGLVHADVVQVLKDCPCGDSAKVTVQRGGLLSPSKSGRKPGKNKSNDGTRKSSTSLTQSFHFPEMAYTSGYLPPLRGAYRSKTPTAEMYTSREKEQVSITRPKTPLVDSRNWARSSASEILTLRHKAKTENHNSPSGGPNSNIIGHLQTSTPQLGANGFYAQPKDTYGASGGNNTRGLGLFDFKSADRLAADDSVWLSDLGRTKEFPWLSRSFREPSTTLQRGGVGDRYGFNSRSSDSKLRELYDKENQFLRNHPSVSKMPLDLNGFYTPDDRVLNPYLTEDWRNKPGAGPGNGYPFTNPVANNWEHQQIDPRTTNNPAVNGPFYTYFNNGQHSNPFSNYENPGGPYGATTSSQQSSNNNAPNSSTTGHNFQAPESSSGYYTSAAISPHPSNTSQSLSGSQYDSLTRRKHSTSFEHEQPITSLMGQFPKEMPQLPSPYGMASQRLLTTAGPPPSSVSGLVEMTVTLLRQESGFGFRIIGGTEEGSQVSIGHIVPQGSADLDSRLHSGDEIMFVDGQSVLNTSHHHVVQLMGSAAQHGKVTLGIRRKLASFDPLFPSKSPDSIFPYDINVTRKENEGFGFVIISSVSRVGSTIGRIIEASPAERCGQLHVGDRILAVNGVSILNMHHGEIVNLIKDSGFSVALTIGAPQDDGSSSASISQKGDDQSLEHDDHYYAVEIARGLRGFGFSIRGGREFHNMPLFVLRIAENGPAHQDGRLQVGDQIIEINGINTKDVTHTEAIEIIKQGGNSVRLLVRRGNKIPLAVVDHPSPITPTGSLGTPLSAASSSILNGPICQSSPRDLQNYEMPRDMWNYDTR